MQISIRTGGNSEGSLNINLIVFLEEIVLNIWKFSN